MFRSARRGITLMETTIASLLVGGVLVTTLELVGPTVRSTGLAEDALTAGILADEMLDEIAAVRYADPTGNTGVIGRESGENAADRNTFDDVDDYDGWSSSPKRINGAVLAGLRSGWTVSVRVRHAQPDAPQTDSPTETGVKRITVTVSRNGVTLAEKSILRTRGFDLVRTGR